MGINDEYSRDAYLGDHYVYDSDESDEFDSHLDEESWQDMYSDELLYAWGKINEYVYDHYLILKTNCTYPTFVDFIMDPREWMTSSPSFHAEQIWNKIKKTQVIFDQVFPENFYAWFDSQLI